MREILFRGKTEKTGKWVEGYYCPCVISGFPATPCIISKENLDNGCWSPDRIIPESVGRFTGKTDKKRKNVFEGDIVICDKHIAKVVFNEITCGFEIWWNVVVGSYGEKATHKCSFYGLGKLEVIGNIHDNPELLEVENG